jgi:hypothetical protein
MRLVARFAPRQSGAEGGGGAVRSKPRPARPLVARFAAAGSTASGIDIELERAEGSDEPPSRHVGRVLRRFLSGTYEVHPEAQAPKG